MRVSCPLQTCNVPVHLMTSSFRTETTLPVILRKTSLTPIGPNPGFLSNGIKRQDRKASTEFQKEQYIIFGLHL